MKKTFTQNDYVYYSLIIAILILIFLGITLGKVLPIPECAIYKSFHIYCPGCGCTRAFLAMLKGNLVESLFQNPAVIYTTIMLGIFLISQTISKIRKNKKAKINYSPEVLYLGIGLLVFNCIIKNIILIIS